MVKGNDWNIPKFFLENPDKIGIGYIKECQNQAEKMLKCTLETGDLITDKSHKILVICGSLLTGAFGLFLAWDQPDIIKLALIIIMLISITSAFYAVRGLARYDLFLMGSPPRLTMNEKIVDGYDFENQERGLLYSLLKGYQDRIDFNRDNNLKRGRNINIGLRVLLFIPGAFIISLFLSKVFPGFFYLVSSI